MKALRKSLAALAPIGTAVAKSVKRPERAVFLAAATALTVAGAKRSKRVELIAKPLIMGSLQAGLMRTACERSDIDNALLFSATSASLVGDWFMLQEEFAPNKREADRQIKRGAACFAVNHALLTALALKHGARPTVGEALPRAVGVVEGAAVLALTNKPLLAPLGAYSTALATMSTVVGDPSIVESVPTGDPRRGLWLGGQSFIASDGTILHRRTFFKQKPAGAVAEAFVLASYALAQMLLIDGLEKLAEKPEIAAR